MCEWDEKMLILTSIYSFAGMANILKRKNVFSNRSCGLNTERSYGKNGAVPIVYPYEWKTTKKQCKMSTCLCNMPISIDIRHCIRSCVFDISLTRFERKLTFGMMQMFFSQAQRLFPFHCSTAIPSPSIASKCWRNGTPACGVIHCRTTSRFWQMMRGRTFFACQRRRLSSTAMSVNDGFRSILFWNFQYFQFSYSSFQTRCRKWKFLTGL